MLKRFRKRFIKYDNLVISPSGQFITTKIFNKLFPKIPDAIFEDNSIKKRIGKWKKFTVDIIKLMRGTC